MKTRGILVGLIVPGVLVALACAPKSAPAPAPTLAPQSAPTAAPQAQPAPVTPSAWDKVVADARKEGQVTPYSFGLTGEVGKVVAEGFQRAYGIRVEITAGIGTVLMERIKSEARAGKFIADTYDTSAAFVAQAKGDGLTVSVGNLPALDEKWRMHPSLDKERHILGMGAAITSLYVNTTLVKPGEEPRSYKELLQPKWKGKLLFPSPMTQPNCVRAYVAYKKNNVLSDDFWSQLGKQDLKVSPTIRDQDAMLARGEAAVGVCSVDITANPFIKEGAPVKPVPVQEGTVALQSPAIALLKNSPHPNATRVFINWLQSKDGQMAYHQARGTISGRDDVPSFAPAAARLSLDKFWVSDIDVEQEVGKIQRDGSFAKLVGLEVK